jgi:hypothetical protein
MTSVAPSSAEDAIAALLRGGEVAAERLVALGVPGIRQTAVNHDVLPLIADRLAADHRLSPDFRVSFVEDVHAAAAHDLAVESELRRLDSAFGVRGIRYLLIKGSHLAFTHYARPDLRARTDTDLLIDRSQRESAERILTADLGYAAEPKLSGDFTATQMLYVKREADHVVHMIDLHWRLASPQLFAHVLSFDELYAASVPIATLGAGARGPSDVHALLVACMHRVAHHHDEADQFKWLFDIHLIAARLRDDEWRAFVALASTRGIAAVCLAGLASASRWFGTQIPSWIRRDARLAGASEREQTAAYLTVRPKAAALLDDVRALSSWRDRARLIAEHLFPREEYMRSIWARQSHAPLSLLYAWRLLSGVGAWLKAPGNSRPPDKSGALE